MDVGAGRGDGDGSESDTETETETEFVLWLAVVLPLDDRGDGEAAGDECKGEGGVRSCEAKCWVLL